ncbi:ArsR family transcriptional regulator [Candidatus Woesearchaeota archaeon]|nr:ArsR family transcriptional regulator [Candidatus Woesearchaeota archaeon]
MTYIHQRITIIQIRKPAQRTINDELQWLGTSLGLFTERDRDRSCFRIFLELLKAAKARQLLSSDDLAEKLQLSRGTVVHHLHKLLNAGIVVAEGKRYLLRQDRLEMLVEEIRKDLWRTCEDMLKMARAIDETLHA